MKSIKQQHHLFTGILHISHTDFIHRFLHQAHVMFHMEHSMLLVLSTQTDI